MMGQRATFSSIAASKTQTSRTHTQRDGRGGGEGKSKIQIQREHPPRWHVTFCDRSRVQNGSSSFVYAGGVLRVDWMEPQSGAGTPAQQRTVQADPSIQPSPSMGSPSWRLWNGRDISCRLVPPWTRRPGSVRKRMARGRARRDFSSLGAGWQELCGWRDASALCGRSERRVHKIRR
jgi:hypothetical protein